MSGTVSETFTQHPAWANLDELDSALALAEEELKELDPATVSIYTSLKALADYTRAAVDNVNPVLATDQQLSNLAQPLTTVTSQISTFTENRNPQHLTTAWAHAPEVFAAVSVLPFTKTYRDVKGLATAVADFHEKLATVVDGVSSDADKIRAEMVSLQRERGELAEEIEAQKGLLETAIAEFKGQAESDRLAQESQYETALGELRETRAEYVQSLTDERTQAKQARQEQASTFNEEFESYLASVKEQAEAAAAQRTKEAEQLIQQIREQLELAKQHVEMTGEVAMTGHYQKNAREQKQAADKWRRATVIASALAIFVTILVISGEVFWSQELSLVEILTRSSVAVAFAALATYLGNQSVHHRKREEAYRALELELATLDPFLYSLDDTERQRIKAELALRYFKGVDRAAINPESVSFNGS